MRHHSALQQKDGLKGTVLHLEGDAQLSPSTDVLCGHEKGLGRTHRKFPKSDPKREIRPPLFPGVHYPVSRKKPMCNLYLHRSVVQRRELVSSQEEHTPDTSAHIIQLT